ncbi:hypothetical protein L2E82_26002 [Cichorium intybus]|uniref:Uncharacterized protein n=1 Tax=Cichorium intybus TaxID=13427 RepID=A0ACB9E582_CICIN|nr:hypothetical protein L2E82_26002 [Cichorium intybus]
MSYDLLQELMDAKIASNSGANCGGTILPYPFQQGTPSFDVGEAFALVMTAFVAVAEVNLAVSASIPAPIVAALYHFFFAYVGFIGFEFPLILQP